MRKTVPYIVLWVVGLAAVLYAESVPTPPSPSPTPPAKVPAAAALPTPLPATLFQGRVQEAYKAAAEIPDVLAANACYCGCDKSQGHRHLLDCFADSHGAT